MATIRRTRGSNGAPSAEVPPEEAAKIRASAAGKEQAPSTRHQALFANWREASDTLGDPFEVEHIPVSKLRAMRRDPMLGFGLSFIKTPHVRARWFINARSQNGPNAQIAAHLDHDLRWVYPSLVLQFLNSLDFGFQAIAKRFEFRVPAGTFIETDPESGEQTESPIWSEGGIQPIAWKPFVALAPEYVEPLWTGAGDFNGIDYNPATGTVPPGVGARQQRAGPEGSKKFKIDLWHSLWATHMKDENFGSIFGYPRLGYAYRYWWSYWFRWAIADRAFERKADPSVIVKHPEGEFVNEQTGEVTDYGEYALAMGERIRSGGVIALPSDVYEDAMGKGNVPKWEIDFTKDATNFEPFDKSFDYLDVQKLRSLWIPEQAFLEGKGGTSSRNVAAEMGDSFIESQAVLASQIVEHVNRWVIPQWLAVNYPEFLEESGRAELVMQGFADEDVEFTNQVVQLIGQQESGMREILKLVDLKRLLQARGTPIASFEEQQRRDREIAEAAAAAGPPETPAIPGAQVGVIPTATGFSYVQPSDRMVVTLSDSGTDFIENLPDSPHYEDKAIKGLSRQLWNVYRDLYRDEYQSAIEAIQTEDVEASDDDVELAVSDFTGRAARLIRRWTGSAKWPGALERSLDIFNRIFRRAARVELQKVNLSAQIGEEAEDWVRDHLAEMAMKVAETTRTEVRDFVAARMAEGVTDRKEIAQLAREHFSDFPQWKSDRLVRTEVRDIYNAATLLAARSAGLDRVQAADAQFGPNTDADCIDRNGKIYSISDALREREHPNGTLAWKILPAANLSIKRVEDIGVEGAIGRYDPDSETVYLAKWASEEQETDYLRLIGEALRNGAVRRDEVA